MGNDPGEVKKEIRATARAAERERQNTFEVAAREWFASYSPALTAKHAAKLQRYLDTILFPRLGNKSVTDLEPSDFLGVIRPTENKGHITTAHKLMATHKFTTMPTPADFIDHLNGGNVEDQAEVESGKVLQAISTHAG